MVDRSEFVARRIVNLMVVFAVLVVFYGANALGHEGHKPLPTRGVDVDLEGGAMVVSPEALGALGVETSPVVKGNTRETFSAYGSLVVPWNQWAMVSTRLEGRIVAMHVIEGQEVERGEVIAELECPEIEKLVGQIRGLTSEIELSRSLLEGSQRASLSGSIPVSKVLEMQSVLFQQEVQLEVAKGRWLGLGLDDVELDGMLREPKQERRVRLRITSPIAGTVLHTDLSVGKVVGVKEHLVEVVDTRTLWMRVEVLEKDLGRVRIGSEVVFRSIGGQRSGLVGESVGAGWRRGKIEWVEPVLDPLTHVATVWVFLENDEVGGERLFPGGAGVVELEAKETQGALLVPRESLIKQGVEQFVLVEQERTKRGAGYRKVVVGVEGVRGDVVEVRSNELFPDDRVVTRGSHELGHLFVQSVFRIHDQTARTIGLQTQLVGGGEIVEVLIVDGVTKVRPQGRAMVSSQMAGQLERIEVKPGERVRAGQVIAWVSSLEYLDYQLALRRAKLEKDFREGVLARLLQVGGGVPERQIMEARSQADVAGYKMQEAERTLSVVGVGQDRLREILEGDGVQRLVAIEAPMDGVVVDFDKRLGHVLSREERICEVHATTEVWIEAYVPEGDSKRVVGGQQARWSWGREGAMSGWGEVVGSGNTISKGSQTLSVWIRGMRDEVSTSAEGLPVFQNMLCRVAIQTGVSSGGSARVVVPLEAVYREGRDAYVFVERVGLEFERRRVGLGRMDDQRVEITRGLQEGERIATRGVRELQIARAALR
jgi:multidrug efflux pump subunit AcrA (membrane-fusion protein)